MVMSTLLTVELVREHDVVLARQRARQLAAELKLDGQDQTRFATAVSEIARNAYQYAGGGRVEFSVESGPPAVLVARVTDRGPGIAEAISESVFEPFFTTRTSGTGLGLAIVKRLVELQEGTVALKDRPGGGTIAQVTLPRAPG